MFSSCTSYFVTILLLCRVPQRYSALVFPPHQRLIFFILISYFNSTGASEKYVPAISPVINQDTLGGLCPMPDVRLEGFSPHRSSDRYYSPIISFGLPWPLIYIVQYSAVLHWLEPNSAYLEVSHACCRIIICQQHLGEEIFSGRPHLEDFLSSGTSRLLAWSPR